MDKNRRIVAVVSRHELLAAQVADLEARGYTDFVPVLPPHDRVARGKRFQNHHQVWDRVIDECGKRPDLIVAVLPIWIIAQLAVYAGDIPVLQAPMAGDTRGGTVWSGRWCRVVGAELITEEWG